MKQASVAKANPGRRFFGSWVKRRIQTRRFTRSRAANIMYFVLIFSAGLFTMLPLIYAVVTSFKPLDELLLFPPQFFVRRPTIENYVALPSLLSDQFVPLTRYQIGRAHV